jgi:NTE family protein
MKRILLLIMLFLVLLVPAFAESQDLLLADQPIRYGEQDFIRRIEERTKNEREPIGLVLSGGSARAFAHVGVLKALESQGIVPDFIISNSMGSIISILYASGMSPDQIVQLMEGLDFGSLFSVELPVNEGLLSAARLQSLVLSLIGKDTRIEDLDIPVLIVTEDLVSKRQVHICEGDLGDILLASFALPVYFSSIPYESHLLVDGGLANIAPVSIAYEYTDNVIVSTSFYEGIGLNRKNPLTALNIAIDIGKRRQAVTDLIKHPDCLWIRCDVEGFSFMDFKLVGVLTDRGAQALDGVTVNMASGAIGTEMEMHRELYSKAIEKTLTQYSAFQHISLVRDDFSLTFNLDTCLNGKDSYFIRNDSTLTFDASYSIRDFSFSLSGGMSWAASSFGQIAPLISFKASWLPLYCLRLDIETSGIWDIGASAPSLYGRQSLVFRSPRIMDIVHLELSEIYEYAYDQSQSDLFSWDGSKMLLSILGKADFSTQTLDLQFRTGSNIQLDGPDSHYYWLTSARVGRRIEGMLWFELTGLTRLSILQKEKVPLFQSDGMRTNQASLYENDGDFTVVANARLGLLQKAEDSVSIGEMLLLSNCFVNAFADLLWNRKGNLIPYATFGLEIGTTAALLGLRELDFTFFAGYDMTSRSTVGGIMLGKEF